MTNVLHFPAQRTLAQVLAELMLAQAELSRLQSDTHGRALTDAEDARWSKLEDTVWLRRDEARAMIEQATGVSLAQIEAASL